MRLGQTVIIRTDLFTINGLTAAQVAHIHALPLIEALQEHDNLNPEWKEKLIEWSKMPYIFVKKVPNLEALTHFYLKARQENVPVRMWKDSVFVDLSPTQRETFHDIPIGICLGPEDDDKIRGVVGDLPLL